jgi:dipeptidyl aminopeptidase/acylaminoacyl peptidase
LCTPSNRCLALVTLRGSDNVVVRDITDLNHPVTVSSLGPIAVAGGFGETVAHFVSATQLSYPLNGGIIITPLSGSPRTSVAGTAKGAGDPAWSPDGTTVVYVTVGGSQVNGDEHLDVHLLRGGTDRIVGSAPGLGVGGCETLASCTLPNWLDSRLAFSPDGKFFSFVAQGFGASFLYVWSSDGTLITSDKTHIVTMSTWSAQSLYFRGEDGVEAWHDGATSKFLLGMQWIKPSGSPAGGEVVYTVRDRAGWGHIYLVDTATGKFRELKAQRTDAVFLTSRYVWYQGERACTADDLCGPNPPFHPTSGKTYIYDLQTGTESTSIITGVYDVWPHAA